MLRSRLSLVSPLFARGDSDDVHDMNCIFMHFFIILGNGLYRRLILVSNTPHLLVISTGMYLRPEGRCKCSLALKPFSKNYVWSQREDA